jgi:hypothetical protein
LFQSSAQYNYSIKSQLWNLKKPTQSLGHGKVKGWG